MLGVVGFGWRARRVPAYLSFAISEWALGRLRYPMTQLT